MSIRFVRTFIHVARLGSFSAAARALGMTQSTISLQMKSLEAEMNAELFDRSERRPTINGRGHAFLERAEEVVRLYDQLGLAVTGYDDLAGSLKFGAVGSVATGILPEALRRLREAHPNLQTRVTCGLSADLVMQVDCGDLDAAIVSSPPSALAPNLVWTPVNDEPLVVIAAKNSGSEKGRELLENQPFIRFDRKAWAGRFIERMLRKHEIHVNGIMELDSLEAISLMVGRGLGVSLVPQRPIKKPFPASLRIMPFQGGSVRRSIGMVTRTGSTCARLIEALYKILAGTVAASRIE